MAAVLILSSFVAASPVGGGAQVAALAALEIEAILAPTVLFGRHPGLGPPGGGAVSVDMFEDVLEGIAATGAYAALEAVITGYFADPAQVAAAARTIEAVRAVNPKALIVVDPIMGDDGKGLYVKGPVAAALAADLVPRADLLTPNAWELGRLTGRVVATPGDALAAARDLGRAVLVSSVPVGRSIGVLWADEKEAWLACHRRAPSAPNGTGDLLTCLFVAALIGGASPADALETAVSDVASQVLGRDTEISVEAVA
jgi:pyridoxine kinase